jgi:hypothetical protein
MKGPDSGQIDAYIRVRKDSSSPSYILLRGRAAGSEDVIAWSGQGIFPLSSSKTLDYMVGQLNSSGGVEFPGFNYGCNISLVGYY